MSKGAYGSLAFKEWELDSLYKKREWFALLKLYHIYNDQKAVKPELMDSDNTINESLLL